MPSLAVAFRTRKTVVLLAEQVLGGPTLHVLEGDSPRRAARRRWGSSSRLTPSASASYDEQADAVLVDLAAARAGGNDDAGVAVAAFSHHGLVAVEHEVAAVSAGRGGDVVQVEARLRLRVGERQLAASRR